MTPLSHAEIQKLALELKTSEGDRLQEVRIHESVIALGLYSSKLYWLVVDMNPQSPQLLCIEDLASLGFKNEKKPVQLFMKAHFVGRKLLEIEAPSDLGRVLILKFGVNKEIEIRLFPRGQNFIVQSGQTKVSLHKPKELKPSLDSAEAREVFDGFLKSRSAEWLAKRQKCGEPVLSVDSKLDKIKKKEKLNKAIKKIEVEIQVKESLRWHECGEWLKEHQTLLVPSEFSRYVDQKKTFAENLEICFKKAKENKQKIVGAKNRIKELAGEILSFESPHKGHSGVLNGDDSALKQASAKGRTFQLDDGVVLFVGKSADDNLRLLRKAKPWHYWMHLRDRPSCHGLIQRNKNQSLSDAQLHLAAHKLIANNFGEKQKNYRGDKFDIIVAECRFVRPIKGDRHGRVNYSEERAFTHLFQD